MKKTIVLLAIITAGLLLAGCATEPQEVGWLEGQVTIGPIWPVERPGEKREIPCEVYEARKIMVYDRGGNRLIEQVDIDCNGYFQVDLEPATYTVDINHLGIDHSSEVPTQIEIRSGETVRLDIDIDTGIR
jgi:hypothetical protein